ncbi:MAG TPA: hypothetical protein VGF59_14525 [Bryobacteraceae bacterium]|jgi:hypothetical protein
MHRRLFTVASALSLLFAAGCDRGPKTAINSSTSRPTRPTTAPTAHAANPTPDAAEPSWVTAYRALPPQKVIVIDERERPMSGARVHLQSLNLDYPGQSTGQDGTVILGRSFYIDRPWWLAVERDGYEHQEITFPPRQWPLVVKLRQGQRAAAR